MVSHPRCIVLMTRGRPQLRVENVRRRLSRWTGLVLGSGSSFIKGNGEKFLVSLNGETDLAVTLLQHSYWDYEDIRPYVLEAALAGDEELAELMSGCGGATVIEEHRATDGPTATAHLAKLAAAIMEVETPVVVVPPAMISWRVDNDIRSVLGRATRAEDLLGPLVGFHVAPVQPPAAGKYLCYAQGMQLFDLPDMGIYCNDNLESAMGALRAAAKALVGGGKAPAVGETLSVEGAGELRFIEPEFEPANGSQFGAIGLERMG